MRMLQMLVLPLIVSSLITGEKSFLVLSAKIMLVVRVPLCAPTAGVGIRWANSDKPKPTALVTVVYPYTPADSVVAKRSRRLGKAKCGVSNAQLLRTNKGFPALGILA